VTPRARREPLKPRGPVVVTTAHLTVTCLAPRRCGGTRDRGSPGRRCRKD